MSKIYLILKGTGDSYENCPGCAIVYQPHSFFLKKSEAEAFCKKMGKFKKTDSYPFGYMDDKFIYVLINKHV